jgi:hypothetical protein
MNAGTVLEKVEAQRQEGEKDHLLKGLSALLVTTPESRTKARSYIEGAICYIKQN